MLACQQAEWHCAHITHNAVGILYLILKLLLSLSFNIEYKTVYKTWKAQWKSLEAVMIKRECAWILTITAFPTDNPVSICNPLRNTCRQASGNNNQDQDFHLCRFMSMIFLFFIIPLLCKWQLILLMSHSFSVSYFIQALCQGTYWKHYNTWIFRSLQKYI